MQMGAVYGHTASAPALAHAHVQHIALELLPTLPFGRLQPAEAAAKTASGAARITEKNHQMTAGNKKDPPAREPPVPSSGEGADSALDALKKKRVPAPSPPPAGQPPGKA
jgi:hypothetical protein